MNINKIILCIVLISSCASMKGEDIVPDSTPTPFVSVTLLRSYSKSIENPFYNKKYLLTHCFLLPNSNKEVSSLKTKFIIVENTDENGNKEKLLWQVNQSNSDNTKLNPTIDIKQKTKFIITKNGSSNQGSYPHKLVIPTRSVFIGVFFLDYLQTWQVVNSSGNTVTLKALQLNSKSNGKISGKIDIPDTETYDIELSSGATNIFNRDDIVTVGVGKYITSSGASGGMRRRLDSGTYRSSIPVTLINLSAHAINNKSTATFVTGNFKQ